MLYNSDKLIQLDTQIRPGIGLDSDTGRKALAEQIKADIDRYCQLAYDDGPRSHLGASEIGHKCSRYLWYKFRWAFHEEFSGRMQRLFNRGHKEEDRFIEWLRGIGVEVIQTDSAGKQMRMSAIGGHFGGSCDGHLFMARYQFDDVVLVEMKTYGVKSFNKLKEEGVQKAKPQHWSQMCVYGVGFNIRYAVYIAICKDTDEIWIEVFELDPSHGNELLTKAHRIIVSAEPPPRLSDNPSFFECKWCPAHRICHTGEALERNCRSCRHSSPIDGAEWQCAKYGKIPKEAIPQGCDGWEPVA